MIKNIFICVLGFLLEKSEKVLVKIKTLNVNRTLGGGERKVGYPFVIRGLKNIEMETPVSIGPGATIYTTGAKLKIKKHVITGPNLTIITGDHKYIPGRWIDSVKADEKEPYFDQDVIIEEDVWIGANVTILKGVTIGRSSIVAAGSLVIKDVPPYCIVGGIPAKVLKKKWSDEEIKEQDIFINKNM